MRTRSLCGTARPALILVSLLAALGVACADSDRPNILLISLDTTRADRLGCYGFDGALSPNIDRLAGDSVLYRNAVSTTSWTLPAHASLFTGKFTTSHGARMDAEGPIRLSEVLRDNFGTYPPTEPSRWARAKSHWPLYSAPRATLRPRSSRARG